MVDSGELTEGLDAKGLQQALHTALNGGPAERAKQPAGRHPAAAEPSDA